MDTPQFEELYIEMEKPLFNVVYRWLWNEAEAMDVVQEAFMRIWQRRETVAVDRAKPYLFKTAIHLASNRRRARKLWKMTGLAAIGSGNIIDDPVIKDEQERIIRNAVESLPEKMRRVLVLCRFYDKSYKQVGELLGIPVGTVASRHHQALRKLRRILTCQEANDGAQ